MKNIHQYGTRYAIYALQHWHKLSLPFVEDILPSSLPLTAPSTSRQNQRHLFISAA